jgi:hypothetical protein
LFLVPSATAVDNAVGCSVIEEEDEEGVGVSNLTA